MTELKRLVDESGAPEVERGLLESAIGEAPPAGAKARLRGVMGLRPVAPLAPVRAPTSGLFTTVKWVGIAAVLVAGAAAVRSFVAEPPSSASRAGTTVMPARTDEAPNAAAAAASVAPSIPATSVAPAVLAAESNVAPPPVASAPARASAASATTTAPSASASSKPLSLRAEIELLDAIRTDLAGGNAAGALQKLDRYDRDFGGRGSLADEASVMRVEALLAHGEKARAEAFASRFLASHRGTPYEARIKTLLATH